MDPACFCPQHENVYRLMLWGSLSGSLSLTHNPRGGGRRRQVRDILNDVEAALAAAGRLQGDPNATSLPHSDDTIHDLF